MVNPVMMHVVLLLDAKLGDLWLRRQSIVDFAASLRQMSATIDRRRVQVRTFFLKLSALGNVNISFLFQRISVPLSRLSFQFGFVTMVYADASAIYTSDLAQRTPMPLPPCDGCSALTVAARVQRAWCW